MSRPSRLAVALAVLVAVLLSWSGTALATPGPPAPPPRVLSAPTGGGQTTPAGTAFEAQLGATVQNVGPPVAAANGVPVTFTITGPAVFPGNEANATVNSATIGVATSPTLTALPTPGTVTVTATAPGVTTPVVYTLTVGPNRALVPVGGDGQTRAASQPELFARVVVELQSGGTLAAVPPATVTFTVTGPATFAGNSPRSAVVNTGANGRAQSPPLVPGPTPGTVTVRATAPATTPATFTLTVTPTRTLAAVSGAPQAIAGTQQFPQPLVARLTQPPGAPEAGRIAVPDVLVTFTITGPATFPGNATVATATTVASGDATSPVLTAGATPGTVSVTATAPGADPVTFTPLFTLAPPTPPTTATNAITAASGNGQSAAQGAAFGAPLVAAVASTATPPVAVSDAVVTFTVAGPAAFGESTTATATTNGQGRATAPALTAGTGSGAVTVTASTPGTAGPATFTLFVAPPSDGDDAPGGPGGEEMNPDEEVDQTEADGSEAAAGGDQVEEVPLGSVDTGGWS